MKFSSNLDKIEQVLSKNFIINKVKSKKIAKDSSKVEQALRDIYINHNHSWDEEIELRNRNNMNSEALFYRGNVITYNEMFSKRDLLANILLKNGVSKGDIIPLCMSNTPEFVYTILAASRIGAKVKIFGSHFDKGYLQEILDNSCKKLLIATEDNYLELKDVIKNIKYEKIVVSSLSESLKNGYNPFSCLDSKYNLFNDKLSEEEKSKVTDFRDFMLEGRNCHFEKPDVKLDDDFLITYTSGSTLVGLPKEIIQQHKSLVVMARLHDKDLSGLPEMKDVRMLAHIPPYSNTDVITSISDPLAQGCSVALEPIYDRNFFNRSLVINRPNAVAATRSFWIHAALTYNKEFPEQTQRQLYIPISVGEANSLGEEKLINKWLKEVQAGREKLPITAILSIGGGDCEHGGIYFTLYHALKSKLTASSRYGLTPFKGLDQAILDENNNHITDGRIGRLVAIGPTTMRGYNNNQEATDKFFIKDASGKTYGDCKVWANINKYGKTIIHGRIGNEFELIDGSKIPTFVLAELVEKASNDILSVEVVNINDSQNSNIPVIHYSLQPDCKREVDTAIDVDVYLRQALPEEITNKILYHPHREEFALTGSGKRDVNFLEKEGTNNSFSVCSISKPRIEQQKNKKKKIYKKI